MFAVLVVVGLVAFPTLGAAMVAPVAFAGLTFLEGHFITPTIIGRRLALNALAVLLALAFWTWLWGPMGGFLSSPLLIVALILKEHLMPVEAPQFARRLNRFQARNFLKPANVLSAAHHNRDTGKDTMTDTANVDRLQRDVSAVKTDISALTSQISDVMNSLAGNARPSRRRQRLQAGARHARKTPSAISPIAAAP